jgi:dihydropteroate synthase
VLGSGADLINDIAALRAPGALAVVAASRAAVCLMHMQGTPGTMQAAPAYDDVVGEVAAFLAARGAACEAAGIARDRILLDPGIGFGKSLDHNVALLRATAPLSGLGYPLLAGVSRKSMIGALTGRRPEERVWGSVAAGLFAVARCAAILRVHDVAATRDALAVWSALKED